jgi:7,8-dihydro-6-hydroxymethylpterin-pyrophosphokinase
MGGVIVRILAPAEDLLLGREDAHHGEQITVDLDLLAYGRVVAKKFLAVSEPRTTTLAPRCAS